MRAASAVSWSVVASALVCAWPLVSVMVLGGCAARSQRESAPGSDGAPVVTREGDAGGEVSAGNLASRVESGRSAQSASRGTIASAAPVALLLPRAATADSALVARGIAGFRREIPAPRLQPSLEPAVNTLLSRAADALNRNDIAQAIDAANEAVRIAPERLEPLEVLLLAQLSAGRPDEVRATLKTLSAVEPSSPIALAFAGLDAAQRGEPREALAAFAWFVGEGAVPRRGAAIPLPTAPGEIEEQAALAALRLGAAQAAIDALDAALAVRSGDERSARAVRFLRAEALAMLGRTDEALAAFDALGEAAGVRTSGNDPAFARRDAVGLLAVARADELRVARGQAAIAARAAVDEFARAPLDDFVLRRVVRLGPELGAGPEPASPSSATAKSRSSEPAARDASEAPAVPVASETSGALRAAVVRAACAATRASQESADKALAEVLEREAADRAAARGALRILARRGIGRAVDAAAAAVAAHPNELDALTTALAASGFEVDSLLAELRSPRAGAEALRSRLLARFARVEEAYAVADSARSRDRAAAPALAAAALAAAELGDDTLLAEIDDDALGAGDSIARTLAAAWLALGDAPRARDRAERAVAHDARDERARLLLALAVLSTGRNEAEIAASDSELGGTKLADREQAARAAALESLRALARGTGAAAADARARLVELERPNAGSSDATERVSGDPVETLTRAIRQGEIARLRLGAACLALADDIEPSTLASSGAATAGSSASQALASVSGAGAWAKRIVNDAPALAARRQLCARLASGAAGTLGPESTEPSSEGPLAGTGAIAGARSVATAFDRIAVASEPERARQALSQVTLRPRTPSSLAATARAAAACGDFATAAAALESSVAVATGPLSARSARALLSAASDLAERDASSAARLEPSIDGILARMARTGPEDMLPAMRVLVLAGAGESALERAATMLARAARDIAPSELPSYGTLLQAIVAIERDPYPASVLARALVREERFAPAVRARLAASAIALDAAAGADPDRTAALVVGLVGEGIPVLARGAEPAPGLALALVRASSIASMVGDESMSEELLRSALAASPDEPEALNNLAYRLIERGSITPEAIDYAERAAAAAPDDASILDTLGLLRYHQGRLRDDASGVGAISLFRQALRLEPETPSLSTLDHLGDALWRDGDQAGALRAWRQIPDLALLRYPPANIARNLADFQRREFGLELVEPERFLRRQYGEIVQRADRKIQEVSRGSAPSVAPVVEQR